MISAWSQICYVISWHCAVTDAGLILSKQRMTLWQRDLLFLFLRNSLVLLHPQVGSVTKTSFCRKLRVQDDKMGTVSSLNELLDSAFSLASKRGWLVLILKNSKAISLVACQEDIPHKSCIPLHPHQGSQYHQIPSHHCNFGQELVGCRKEVCVEHVCPFTDLCLPTFFRT